MKSIEIINLAIWYLLIYELLYVDKIRKIWFRHIRKVSEERLRDIRLKSAKPFDCYPCACFWTAVIIVIALKLPIFESVAFCAETYLAASIIEKLSRL